MLKLKKLFAQENNAREAPCYTMWHQLMGIWHLK